MIPQEFLGSLVEAPEDSARWLVLSDWFRDHGHEVEADVTRWMGKTGRQPLFGVQKKWVWFSTSFATTTSWSVVPTFCLPEELCGYLQGISYHKLVFWYKSLDECFQDTAQAWKRAIKPRLFGLRRPAWSIDNDCG